MRKLLKKITKVIGAFCLCLPLTANIVFAEGKKGSETNPVTNSADLVEAIKAAENGDVIYLAKGTFSTYEGANQYTLGSDNGKSLTFIGVGANTVWQVGPQTITYPINGEYNSDYTFGGCKNITFQSMTLTVAGDYDYLGFCHINGDVLVENCTINGRTLYWGYNTTTFKNTTFNAPEGGYALYTGTGHEMTFDTCVFNTSGKVIQVYRDYSLDEEVTVNYKDCTVNNTKDDKSVLTINDYHSGGNMVKSWIVNISGKNVINGVMKPDGTGSDAHGAKPKDIYLPTKQDAANQEDYTCSRLFEFNTKYGGNAGNTVVTIDGTTVWENGKMVSHSIDTANDKYTDGYKDDAFTVTYGEWELQEDGSYVRTITKVCNYCGYKEEIKETGYKVTYTDGVDDEEIFEDKSEIVVKDDATPVFGNDPTRSGYRFAGWDPEVTDTVTGTVVYTAKWVKQYNVTYKDGVNGEVFADQTTTVDDGTKTPSFDGTPTRDGYTFAGWDKEISDTVTSDVVYTAKWAKNSTPTPSSTPTATPTSKPSSPSTPSSKPTSPTSSSSTKPSTYKPVDTGDTSDMYLWIGITGIAVIAGVCMIIARKKQA